MTEKNTQAAERGSQMWLQRLVNENPVELNLAIRNTIPALADEKISWVSPLAAQGYAEYQDQAFLDHLGLSLPKRPLKGFWPSRGPVWDGLARTESGEVLIVEAKAHIPEALSPPTQASGASRELIDATLEEVKNYLGGSGKVDWSGTFYQVTNRLAHLYLLRTLNDIPAHLIFLYFVGDRDMGGPESIEEWEGAIKLIESYLGVSRHKLSPYVHHVFYDVRGGSLQ